MNLISKLPLTLTVNNEVYEINTDFKKGIEFEGLFKENLTNQEFWNKALKIYYPILDCTIMDNELKKIKRYENIISNSDEAIQQMLLFHRCGKEIVKDDNKTEQKEEILSYTHDWDLIVGAFKNQYNVNLYKDELHWWEFKAYFNALKEDTKIKQIINIRGTDMSKLSKEQQAYYRKLKNIYKIPQDKEKVEQNNSLADILRRGGSLAELEST